MRFTPLAAAAALLVSCHPASSGPDLDVRQAWARETAPGQTGGAVYLTIVNRGGSDDRLVGVATPRAAMAMLHGSSISGGIMAMRMVAAMDVSAGATVSLAPLGSHVMLEGVAQPLRMGETIPLTLNFAKSGKRLVEAKVLAAGSAGPAQ